MQGKPSQNLGLKRTSLTRASHLRCVPVKVIRTTEMSPLNAVGVRGTPTLPSRAVSPPPSASTALQALPARLLTLAAALVQLLATPGDGDARRDGEPLVGCCVNLPVPPIAPDDDAAAAAAAAARKTLASAAGKPSRCCCGRVPTMPLSADPLTPAVAPLEERGGIFDILPKICSALRPAPWVSRPPA